MPRVRISQQQWDRWIFRGAQLAQLCLGVALAVAAVASAAEARGIGWLLTTGPAATALYILLHLEAAAQRDRSNRRGAEP